MKLSKLRVDKTKTQEGVWCDTGIDGLRLRVARIGNLAYRDYISKNSKALQAQARRGQIEIAEVERINKDAAAKHILVGWEGMEEDNGKAIPYSSERARKLFDELPDLYDMTMEYAQNMSLFLEQTKEDSKGN